MISQIEIESLYEFLQESSGTFDNVLKAFGRKFPQEFQPVYFLYQCLCDNLLTRQHRLVSIYLVYNSDLRVLLNEIYTSSIDQFERKFIYNPEQYANMTIRAVTDEADKFTDTFPREMTLPPTIRTSVRNVIPNTPTLKQAPPTKEPPLEQYKKLDANFLGFDVDFLRPKPVPMNLGSQWLDVASVVEVQWNYTIQVNQDRLSQVKEIMQKAYTSQISDQEYKLLQDYFDKDNVLIRNCGFTAAHYPALIERNPQLAVLLTLKLHKNQDFTDLLDKFVESDVTKNALDVFSQISGQIKLPIEFMTFYVHYCIQQCTSLKEKTLQNRMARLVCIFTKLLLKNKWINYKELHTELQAFSIEFSKIAEASSLWKDIKDAGKDTGKGVNNDKQL